LELARLQRPNRQQASKTTPSAIGFIVELASIPVDWASVARPHSL
jgi:hypothetical protein